MTWLDKILAAMTAIATGSINFSKRVWHDVSIAIWRDAAIVKLKNETPAERGARTEKDRDNRAFLHDVLEAGIDRGERELHVLETLLALGAEVARRAGECAVRRHAELAGQIDGAARTFRLHHVGVAARRGDGRRIEKAMHGLLSFLRPSERGRVNRA